MKKAHRIGYWRYFDEKEFEKHLSFIKRNIDVVDEVALFVEYSHFGYWAPDNQRKLSALLKKRINAYREAGIVSVGLNVLDTVGHLEEAWEVFPNPPMQTMVSINGDVSTSCLCPTTDEYRKYIAERYAILAGSEPDFIWVDDDLRIDNHGIAGPCFCPHCIEKFNRTSGRSETFESLTTALKSGNNPELARVWHSFNCDTYSEISVLIEQVIHSVTPDIVIGEMTSTALNWLNELKALKGRPGGGFYEDSNPRDMLRKFLACEIQLSTYPKIVTDRQYEFENFPYQELAKSKTIMALEPYFALMYGCNGVAFNTSGHDNYRLMETLHANKARYDALSDLTAGTHNRGICVDKPDFTSLLEIGIPSAAVDGFSDVYYLSEQTAASESDEKLVEMLSGGVYVSAGALSELDKRGLLELCGVKAGKVYHSGVAERFTAHYLNGNHPGYIRNCYMNFYDRNPDTNYVTILEPTEGAEVISEAVLVTGEGTVGSCMTVYENRLGGRVAVSTYDYPNFIQYTAKREQLIRVFDWLCRGKLPIIVEVDAKVVPVYREAADGRFVCMLANMSFDATGEFSVVLRTKEPVKLLGVDGKLTDARVQSVADGTRVTLESLDPWNTVILASVE